MLFVDRIKGMLSTLSGRGQGYQPKRYAVHQRLIEVEKFLNDFPIQFTLGHVIECVTNSDSYLSLSRDSNINTIKALKHTGKQIDSKNIESMQSATYYPLFRGIVDAPTQGDPVLLCEFGGRKYYLGPLNTINNPNFNPDVLLHLDNPEEYNSGKSDLSISLLKSLNVNPHFKTTSDVKRLYKPISSMDYIIEGNKDPFNRGVGDLMLEGRFGNSIRIGSRSGRPNIFISNGRGAGNRVETLNDGGLITMTSFGSFKDHFSFPVQKIEQDLNLPSNIKNTTDRKIKFDSKYNKSQILILSDRLVFASRSNNLLLSSYFDVEIGSGRNLKIFTKNDTIIDSGNIYLGKPLGEKKPHDMEPAALGNELVGVLKSIIDAIGKCNVGGVQPAGTSLPINGIGAPGAVGTGWSELGNIKSNLDKINSKYVFIGKNQNWK